MGKKYFSAFSLSQNLIAKPKSFSNEQAKTLLEPKNANKAWAMIIKQKNILKIIS